MSRYTPGHEEGWIKDVFDFPRIFTSVNFNVTARTFPAIERNWLSRSRVILLKYIFSYVGFATFPSFVLIAGVLHSSDGSTIFLYGHVMNESPILHSYFSPCERSFCLYSCRITYAVNWTKYIFFSVRLCYEWVYDVTFIFPDVCDAASAMQRFSAAIVSSVIRFSIIS